MEEVIPPAQRQRRLRFSIRAMLVATAFLAVGIAGLWNYVGPALTQRQTVASILSRGGAVRYDYENTSDKPNVFDRSAAQPGPTWLREVIGDEYFQDVVLVDLSNKPIKDADLAELKKLSMLENLNLSNTQITSAGLVHLAELENLQYLSLQNTQVHDAGLKYLAGLTKLYALILDGTQVTDEGLEYLKGLTNLEEWLGLTGTKVTDDGLHHLRTLKKLRSLNLRQTRVTEAGAQELNHSLPNVHISIGP